MNQDRKLNNIDDSLKKIQTELNPEFLEPAHLKWAPFLEKISSVSSLYKDLLGQITPELKDFVVIPTNLDSNDSQNTINNVLSLDRTNPAVVEHEQCKEEYSEYLRQKGVDESDFDAKMECVSKDAEAINAVCEEALSSIDEFISANGLSTVNIPESTGSRREATSYPIFDFMNRI